MTDKVNEIAVPINSDLQINVVTPIITISGLAELKEEVEELALAISTIELTEDNLKETKKLLAAVRAKTGELTSRRKYIKDSILEPYRVIEEQFKEIEETIKEAENKQRAQIRILDEDRQKRKFDEIAEIWENRVTDYDFEELVEIDQFIKPQHLNKTTTFTKIEREMIDWFEHIRVDIETIKGLSEGQEEILVKYMINGHDISKAIRMFNLNKQEKERASAIMREPEPVPEPPQPKVETALFKIEGSERIKIVEALLKSEGIEYTRLIG